MLILSIKISKVLISPLDWGLGHSTRCIPIIRFFVSHGCHVLIACDVHSASFALLQDEFPDLQFVHLQGYNVRYAKRRRWFAAKILLQIPKIMAAAIGENGFVRRLVREEKIDFVLSDNRFGFFSKNVPSVFLTHQLEIQAGSKWGNWLARKINYAWIGKYAACWIPDIAQAPGLAGALSHPAVLPKKPITYIGLLNRLEQLENVVPAFDFLVLLSGPEPQRTILETKLLAALSVMECTFLLARGLPSEKEIPAAPANGTIVNHLPKKEMIAAVSRARFLIARSGYTTVMEILGCGKKAILIPTPGQTEQELLAKMLMRQRLAYCFEQIETDFVTAIRNGSQYDFRVEQLPSEPLETSLTKALAQIGLSL